MSRIIISIILSFVFTYGYAAELTVYRISGKVNYCKGTTHRPLKLKEVVGLNDEIQVEYESMVELMDVSNAKRYTIKKTGRGTIAQLTKVQGNSVSSLTQRYISYIRGQLKNSSKMVSAQRYTDFATVTRQKASVEEDTAKMSAKERFEYYRRHAKDAYGAYRSKATKDYTDLVRKAWTHYHALQAVQGSPQSALQPMIQSDADSVSQPIVLGWVMEGKDSAEVASLVKTSEDAHRKNAVSATAEEQNNEGFPFTFKDTVMMVGLDESKRFNIGALSPDKMGDVLDMLAGKNYDGVITDCLSLRSQRKLGDWEYVGMLNAMTEQFCAPRTNESVLLAGYLLKRSGYKMRFAMNGERLYLLLCPNGKVYDLRPFDVDGEIYYPLQADTPEELEICPAS